MATQTGINMSEVKPSVGTNELEANTPARTAGSEARLPMATNEVEGTTNAASKQNTQGPGETNGSESKPSPEEKEQQVKPKRRQKEYVAQKS
jgi:hypothetical protein